MGILGGLKKLVGAAAPIVGTALGGPLGGAVGGLVGGLVNSGSNKAAAQQYAQQAAYQPSPITLPGLSLSYDAQGNPVGQVSDPRNQQMANSMFGLGAGMLGNMIAPGQVGTGPLNQMNMMPMLGGAMMQANQGLANLPGMGGIDPSMAGVNSSLSGVNPGLDGINSAVSPYQTNASQILSQLGALGGTLGAPTLDRGTGAFGQAATNALGGLGSFDPNSLATSYADNLRAQARPAEENAANRLAQNLFNTGRLGSTGGANMMGALGKQLEEADISRTIAGQQLAGQEQSRLAGMAQGLQGAGLNEQAANAALTNQDFQNQMGVSGALAGLLGQQSGISQQEFANQQALNNTMFGRELGLNQEAYARSLGLNQEDYARSMGMNQEAFNRAMGMQNQAFNQGLTATQQRFQNAMNLFGAGNTANQTNLQQGQLNLQAALGQEGINMQANQLGLQGGLAAMGLGQQFGQQDLSNLMQMLHLSGNMAAQQAGGNAQAYAPAMQASVAQNDALANDISGIAGALGGLFNNNTGATPGINPNANPLSNPFIRAQLGALQFS